MAKTSGQRRAKSDNERIIEWYESDLEKYRGMIGEYTVHNVIVTEKLIKDTENRIKTLKERERRWDDTKRELLRKDWWDISK